MAKIREGYTPEDIKFEIYEKQNGYGARFFYPNGLVEYYNFPKIESRGEITRLYDLLLDEGIEVIAPKPDSTGKVRPPKVDSYRVDRIFNMNRSRPIAVFREREEPDTEFQPRPIKRRKRPESKTEVPKIEKVPSGLTIEGRDRLITRFRRVLATIGFPITGKDYDTWETILRDQINIWSQRYKEMIPDEAYLETEQQMLTWMGREILGLDI